MAAVRRVFATDHLRLVGLHSHIGSQIFDVDGFELAAHRVIGLLRDVVAEFGVGKTAQIATVDLGVDSVSPMCRRMIRHRSRIWRPSWTRSCATNPPPSACRCRGWSSNPAARSPDRER